MPHRSLVPTRVCLCLLPLGLFLCSGTGSAHEGHRDRTYEISPSAHPDEGDRTVSLAITDETGRQIPARFSILLEGEPWTPDFLSPEGIRFVSIHERKKQIEVILFSRGTGPVRFVVPDGAKSASITAVRGFEFLPRQIEVAFESTDTDLSIELSRFVDLEADGWYAADAHLHYARFDPEHDEDWLAMLDADGLQHGFFLMLKGANIQGLWAEQYAYGNDGISGTKRQQLIPGEEFRCSLQGHINLFGMAKVIEPVQIGTSGYPWNTPSLFDVMEEAKAGGGVAGPAHGGTMAKAPSTMRDAILGGSDFFEIANTFQLWTEHWYQALNCGIHLPAVAGTDLPNYPQRDDWQPFFGDVRTYVKATDSSFGSWKAGLSANDVFVSSGPLLANLSLHSQGTRLSSPADLSGPGDVELKAEILSSQPIHKAEIVLNGEIIPIEYEPQHRNGVHRISIDESITIQQSSWIALRAFGPQKKRLFLEAQRLDRAFVHSAALPILIDGVPIRIESTVNSTIDQLQSSKEAYLESGRYPDEKSRNEATEQFDAAIARLRGKSKKGSSLP